MSAENTTYIGYNFKNKTITYSGNKNHVAGCDHIQNFDPDEQITFLAFSIFRHIYNEEWGRVIVDWESIHIINLMLSEKWGLMPYGKRGIEILAGNKCLGIFNSKNTQNENYFDAVVFMRLYFIEKRDGIPFITTDQKEFKAFCKKWLSGDNCEVENP